MANCSSGVRPNAGQAGEGFCKDVIKWWWLSRSRKGLRLGSQRGQWVLDSHGTVRSRLLSWSFWRLASSGQISPSLSAPVASCLEPMHLLRSCATSFPLISLWKKPRHLRTYLGILIVYSIYAHVYQNS